MFLIKSKIFYTDVGLDSTLLFRTVIHNIIIMFGGVPSYTFLYASCSVFQSRSFSLSLSLSILLLYYFSIFLFTTRKSTVPNHQQLIEYIIRVLYYSRDTYNNYNILIAYNKHCSSWHTFIPIYNIHTYINM